ncbi:D(2)-like dopamine receptor [Hyla sarda]|uniref:D(2)-like dopamine receptor n=1 Tax=Hyla sarda TaxID=327740 RepID=UPI0024C27105|nr:D(2)-like dopamine receptor [Hyla sarda]
MNTDVSTLTLISVRILLCLFGILGNFLLFFFTIPKVNQRIEPYKILLLNLAISNLLTNCMVDIPGILVEIYGTWFLGDLYCKIFWFTASMLITNSILTTFSMSVFWFQKLVGNRPINSNVLRSVELRKLRIFVSLGWLISIAFSMPFLFFCSVNMMKNNEEKDQPKLNQSIFGCQDVFPSRSQKHVYEILYMVLANALPVLGMFFINVRIIIFLMRNRKQVSALKCLKTKRTMTSSVPNCGKAKCRDSGGQAGSEFVSYISSVSSGLEFVSAQFILTTSEDPVKDNIKNVEKGDLIKQVLTLEGGSIGDEENKHLPASMIYNPCNSKESAQTTELCDLKATPLVLVAETGITCIDGKTYKPGDTYSTSYTCYQDQCIEGNNKDKLPELLKSLDSKVRLLAKTPSATTQIRAAISIMAVVGVFFIFWVTYLILKIKRDTNRTQQMIDTASLMAASYTTVIPYIFIYSMKKCPCG